MSRDEANSLSRRQVLQGIGASGVALGFAAAAGASPPDGRFGNNGRGRGGGDPGGRSENRRYVVGMDSVAAVDDARGRASSVHREIDFGSAGRAVAGEFPEEALRGLRNRPDVQYVEEDGLMEAIGESVPWGVDRIDADVAHSGGDTGDGVDVAILDTGIDSDHPDLVDNLGAGTSFMDCGNGPLGDCSDSNANTCHESWDDDHSHGTHCAGIAAAAANDRGVVGVSSQATLHAVRVLGCSGSGFHSDIAAGITYVADQGWDVASLSLGSGTDSFTVRNACQYAHDRGVLVVAAAGNDGPCSDCVSYPAKYDTVVAVGATTDTDGLASFSSTGPEVELAAPGRAIPSTVPGGIASFSGTSMACPHVSGAGGLVMAGGRSRSEARSRLGETAEDVGLSASEGGDGLLDAEAAVGSEEQPSFGETGTIQKIQDGPDDWGTVAFDGSYVDPVVVATPLSYDGGNPAHVRLRNVTAEGFEWKIEEWLYLDEWHTSETAHYVVLEAGTHLLSDGTSVEVGTADVQTDFEDADFSQAFNAAPVVFSQSQTHNGGHSIVTRNRNVSSEGFSVRVQEEEAEQWHAEETVGYVAIGAGDGGGYEVATTGTTVTHDWHTITFDGSYDSPVFVADAQTADGWQPAGLRYRNLTGSSVEVFVEEERSVDEETNHFAEDVGYAVFDGGGPIA